MDYEQDLRSKGITEPHHLLRLTPAVIETLIPDKPIHQRKLAALSRGRNLNASTFSMEINSSNSSAPPKPAPFRSKSADDVLVRSTKKIATRLACPFRSGHDNFHRS